MPHQKKAVLEMRNGCILKGPTGSGKTMTALAYYSDCEDAERLIVITTAMKRDSGDWQAEAREFGLFPEVNSWNNLLQYEDTEGAFFIFDEQRVVGSGIWVQAFLKITKKNKWVLVSATPGDTWLDYAPVFIANGVRAGACGVLEIHEVSKDRAFRQHARTCKAFAEHLGRDAFRAPHSQA
jgi:CRISPR/Cas system-associated endonuclease/helicase Cas3